MTTPKPRATSRRKRKFIRWAAVHRGLGNISAETFYTKDGARSWIGRDGKWWRVAQVELREVRTGKGKRK